MGIAKGMRSEGTPHRDCTGTHSPSDDMRLCFKTRGASTSDTQGFTLGWYVVPLGGTGNAALVLPPLLGMGNQKPSQHLALHWYTAAPFAQKTAPTGRRISAQGATLGINAVKLSQNLII